MHIPTPEQIKAARVLLKWSRNDLAKATGLHINTINRIEQASGRIPQMGWQNLEKIITTFQQEGIRFTTDVGTIGTIPERKE